MEIYKLKLLQTSFMCGYNWTFLVSFRGHRRNGMPIMYMCYQKSANRFEIIFARIVAEKVGLTLTSNWNKHKLFTAYIFRKKFLILIIAKAFELGGGEWEWWYEVGI